MAKKIQAALSLPKKNNYGFVNSYIDEDVRLYLDYNFIRYENTNNDFDNNTAHSKIIDFFDYNSQLVQTDLHEAIKNFKLIKENNLTHFGETRNSHQPSGKGPSQLSLEQLFKYIADNPNLELLTSPMDITLIAPRMGPDCFSDLLTNIIFKELYDYTVTTLGKLKKLQYGNQTEHFYWNSKAHKWEKGSFKELLIDGIDTILVPTHICTKKLPYNISKFINGIILDVKQQEIKNSGREEVPNKKDLLIQELAPYKNQGIKNVSKQYALDSVSENPGLLRQLHDKYDADYAHTHHYQLANDNDLPKYKKN